MLATPLDDPLTTEVVSVPTRGIERWIAQELAARLGTGRLGDDGIAANIAFPFPGRLVQRALAAGVGVEPDRDPWSPDRLVWPLLDVVDRTTDDDALGPLAATARATTDEQDLRARRLGSVRHVADLFDRYGVHRPGMVRRWQRGDDVGADLEPLDERHRWQPWLWRAVRSHLGSESPAERIEVATDRLRDDPTLLDLPDRLAMFGLTTLPASHLDVLRAIASHRDVHLLLLHPSDVLWDRIATAGGGRDLPLRSEDPTEGLVRHPLLRTWGRDARELQLVVPVDGGAVQRHVPTTSEESTTLLARLQAGIRADRAPDRSQARALERGDRSLQVHSCHGRLRQVEVLRDAVLHALVDDPTLEPRDIIVLCPDIEAFAPLVTAVFGAAAVDAEHVDATQPTDGPPALRVRLADRSLRRTNPVLEVVTLLLELVDDRLTVPAVVDLLGREPVRRRFDLDDEDLDLLEAWAVDCNVRWGLHAQHRASRGLPPVHANSWAFGTERLLVGVTMADEDLRTVGGVVPYDGVEGGDSDLAGRLVEVVARLDRIVQMLRMPMGIAAWRAAIVDAADALVLTDDGTAWQRRQLHGILDDVVDEATDAVGHVTDVALGLQELRALLDRRLVGRPSRTSHRTGDLTICTLVPMRSVPHRVVCLLGLDDDVFPRQSVPDSDDLLQAAPRVGDRDSRSEDRQLLLDALLAATDTLVLTHAGRDVRTNQPRPPAVPVDELLDVVDALVAADDGLAGRRQVTTEHPLAPDDPRDFTGPDDDRRRAPSPWGFHPDQLAAARVRARPTGPPPSFLPDRLDPVVRDVVELDDLIGFLQHPVRAFMRQRLEVWLPTDRDPVPETIPAALVGLQAWHVGDEALRQWLRGEDLDRALEVAAGRGLVPPVGLAAAALDTVRGRARTVAELSERVGVTPGGGFHSRDVEVALDDGRVLVGTVPDVQGATIVRAGYSKVAPKHRLATWAQLLALSADDPTYDWRGVTVGRHSWGGSRAEQAEAFGLAPLAEDPGTREALARARMAELVDLHDRGLREPLPLFSGTSAKIARNLASGHPPGRYVHYEWRSNTFEGYLKEDRDPYHLLALGRVLTTEELLAVPCRDDTERGWCPPDERGRVVAHAWRLWAPVLQHERGQST